jgi:TonB family protein
MTLTSPFGFSKALIFLFLSSFYAHTTQAQNRDTLYIVDKQAQFVGGQRALSRYWHQHFRTPFKAKLKQVDGEGIVSFTIDTFGRVQDVFIKQRLTPELDAAAMRAVTEMPRWLPAEKDGQKIKVGQTITYFLTPQSLQNGGTYPVDVEEAEKVVQNWGFNFGIWTGATGLTGNFGNYMYSTRFTLGLTFGFSIKRWSIAMEYDIAPPTKVLKPFEFYESIATTDMRVSALNVYFPISYRFDWSKKWTYAPYLAPTINMLDLKQSFVNSSDKVLENASIFSMSVGICADFTAGKQAVMSNKGKQQVNTVLVRMRFNVTPMNFRAATPTTQLQGTAVCLTVGLILNHRTEK